MDYIYFASSAKASLAATLALALNDQVLWRGLRNSKNAMNANVKDLAVGDRIFLAWRATKHVYLECTVAPPLQALEPTVVIDRISGAHGRALATAGYDTNANGDVEVIRLERIEERYFPLAGTYGGQTSLRAIDPVDRASIASATSIPPEARTDPSGTTSGRRKRSKPTPSPDAPSGDPNVADQVLLRGVAESRAFDSYVMVDWSSSSTPKRNNDSIWIAHGSWDGDNFTAGPPMNLPTRAAAAGYLRELVASLAASGHRVLVGMDFAFGYPAGFAAALGLSTPEQGSWLALHEHFASDVEDSDENRHNRDSFARACNDKIAPPGPGPFWGCTAKAVAPSLTQHSNGVFTFPYGPHGIPKWRVTEARASKRTITQSVWKLNCGVSVGGQTILGIKHLHELARALGGRRWPFDTGWSVPPPGAPAVWFAEIFPSLVRYAEWDHEYATRRDRTQVQSCVRYAAERDAAGTLADAFAQPSGLEASQLARIVDEEGWILFV